MKLIITVELKRSGRRKAAEYETVDATASNFVPWYYAEPADVDDDDEEDCPVGVNVASAALNRTGGGSSPLRGTFSF